MALQPASHSLMKPVRSDYWVAYYTQLYYVQKGSEQDYLDMCDYNVVYKKVHCTSPSLDSHLQGRLVDNTYYLPLL